MVESTINTVPSSPISEFEMMRSLARNEQMRINESSEGSFGDLMKTQIDEVNQAQMQASRLAQMFETGDEDVSLVDVMIATQKSRVAFSALVEMRNKMLTAYQEVMNMQV